MNKEIAGAYVGIHAETSQWERANSKIGKDLDGLGHNVKSFGGAATSSTAAAGMGFAALANPITAVAAAAAAVTAAIVAIAAGAWKAVSSYAQLDDTISILRKVSGKFADEQIAHAEKMADAYGTPRRALLAFDQQITSMIKGVGAGQEVAAKTSVTLADLAADLNSVNNEAGLQGALDAVKDVVGGEYETVKKYVTGIDAAAVKAKALEMGFQKVNGELSKGAITSASIALLFEKTKDMQGDLADTAKSTNNQIGKLQGNFTKIMEDLGKKLEPSLNKILVKLNDWLPLLVKIGDLFAGKIAAGIDWVGAGIENAEYFSRNWEETMEKAGVRVREFVLNIPAYIESAGANLANFANWLKNNWKEIIRDTFSASSAFVGNFFENAVNAGKGFQEWLATGKFEYKPKGFLEGFEASAEKLPDIVKPHLLSLESEIDAINKRIAQKEAERAAALAEKKKEAAKNQFKLDDLYNNLKKDEKAETKVKFEISEGGIGLADRIQRALMPQEKEKDEQKKAVQDSLKEQVKISKNTEAMVNALKNLGGKPSTGGAVYA